MRSFSQEGKQILFAAHMRAESHMDDGISTGNMMVAFVVPLALGIIAGFFNHDFGKDVVLGTFGGLILSVAEAGRGFLMHNRKNLLEV